jgi:hypothetical protein
MQPAAVTQKPSAPIQGSVLGWGHAPTNCPDADVSDHEVRDIARLGERCQ